MDTIGPTSKSPVFIRKPVKRSHKLTSYLPPVGQQKKEKKRKKKRSRATNCNGWKRFDPANNHDRRSLSFKRIHRAWAAMNYGRRKIQLTSPPLECAKQTFHYNKSHCTQGARCYSNRFTIERRGQCSERGLLVQPRNWQYILVPISVGKRGREREGRKTAFRVTMIPRGGC